MRLIELPQRTLQCGKLQLDLSQPQIMGILNVTPDSFSDGGQFNLKAQAIAHAKQMIADGATIIDIGGESTRPNAMTVTIEEELERVIPVVEALADLDVILSIDTSQPQVIRSAVAKGAHIWNDVRALKLPNALQTASELDIPVILMHMRGEPSTMNDLTHYDDLSADIISELQLRIDSALIHGIQAKHIIIDSGFGFAKNAAQNLHLLNEFWQLNRLGFPILAGLSRKRFIGEILEGAPAQDRDIASAAAHLFAIQQGASIIRTHHVKAVAEMLKVWHAMRTA